MVKYVKKYIFLILISTLVILLLLYFYDERENVLNREYKSDGVYIEYPFFNDHLIDGYINSYLDSVINSGIGDLFVDYDYYDNDNAIYLFVYVYRYYGNVVNSKVNKFMIDKKMNTINRIVSDNVLFSSSYYDIFNGSVVNKNKKFVALTFDDGPNHNTSKVLDVLNKYNVKATFFLLGCNINGNEEIIKKMDSMGMEIGNHMFSHKLVTSLDSSDIKKEIGSVDKLVFDVIGKYPTLIRPSYGTYNKMFKSVVDRPIVIWNVDTMDWKYHSSSMIGNRVFGSVHDGSIILMHDIYSATTNSLDVIIPKLQSRGYQFVTVSELYYYKGVSFNGGSVYSGIK